MGRGEAVRVAQAERVDLRPRTWGGHERVVAGHRVGDALLGHGVRPAEDDDRGGQGEDSAHDFSWPAACRSTTGAPLRHDRAGLGEGVPRLGAAARPRVVARRCHAGTATRPAWGDRVRHRRARGERPLSRADRALVGWDTVEGSVRLSAEGVRPTRPACAPARARSWTRWPRAGARTRSTAPRAGAAARRPSSSLARSTSSPRVLAPAGMIDEGEECHCAADDGAVRAAARAPPRPRAPRWRGCSSRTAWLIPGRYRARTATTAARSTCARRP